MALSSPTPSRRSGEKPGINGGLGGFLPLRRQHGQILKASQIQDEVSKRSHKRPSPVAAGRPYRAEKVDNVGSPLSPLTPASELGGPARLNLKSMPVTPLLVSRFNEHYDGLEWVSADETQVSPVNMELLPAELHGSLLLPSQGFPQSEPPQTPVRQRPGRANSEESASSVPGLTNSSSSDTDSERGSMGKLSNIQSTIKQYNRPPAATTTRMDSQNDDHSAPSKPFTAMTPEELLDVLPGLKPVSVAQLWMPAMKSQLQKIKTFLQQNSEQTLSSNLRMEEMAQVCVAQRHSTVVSDHQQDLKSFANETKSVSHSYLKAVASAESLLERDTQQLSNKLKTAETTLVEALTEIKKDEEKIETQAEVIGQLRSTTLNVVHVLGQYIRNNLQYDGLHGNDVGQTREVLQILQDFSRLNQAQAETRHVRIPEETFSANLVACREIHAKLHKYKDVVREQSSMITELSEQLDSHKSKYEKAVEVVKQRDHELALLKQEKEDMQKKVKRLTLSRSTDYYDISFKKTDNLQQHEEEVAERDEQIALLRQQLGSLREEVNARRLDIRSLVTQNQTLSQKPPVVDDIMSKPTPVLQAARRLFTSEKVKSKPLFPRSQSTMALGLPPIDPKLEPTFGFQNDEGYSSKEVASSGPPVVFPPPTRLHEKPPLVCSATPHLRLRRASDSFPELAPRPRVDSLKTLDQTGRVVLPSPASSSMTHGVEKDLPATPPDRLTSSVHASTTKAALQQYQNESEPHKRVLSLVPERSAEDLDEHGDKRRRNDKHSSGSYSATSSDREVFRKSVNALNLLGEGEGVESPVRTPDENEKAEVGIARVVNVGEVARARRPAAQSSVQANRRTVIIAHPKDGKHLSISDPRGGGSSGRRD